MLIRDLGEQALLQKLQRFCPPAVVGDDAALMAVATGQSVVVTTDILVDGVHFSIGLATPGVHTTAPADVGWRAAIANLSDLAAMGASPLGITVGLGLPGDLPVSWVEQLYEGMTDCLAQYNTPIVGGDICRSTVLTVAIAAFGQVLPAQAILRSQAQPGDVILVTGVHGASRAGLELLLNPDAGAGLREGDRHRLIKAHQRPAARLDILSILQEVYRLQSPAPVSFRVAGMDSSDGLADAVLQICRASGVGARLERAKIPMPSVEGWLSPERALDWALYGGEDFELVLCLPPDLAEAIRERLGNAAAIVGSIVAGTEVWLSQSDSQPDVALNLNQGFQHF
ncbi:MAG: thiamine-phosphate kinase [Leptolyngbyaceae cyanobacterium RM2_2_4]|nr:thiamine-phosphate kinase [Leptolyngbyaceae cyanobacterium SM1_4_3]NJO52484.1 thiamine-phosphate kinase [Leptolyngbyaceae cyanobacterium RM2_2_4]